MSFKEFMKESNDLVNKASNFSEKAHEGQVRKFGGGKPYFSHPLRVSKLVKQYGGNDNMIAAGLLHDVLEDTKVTYQELVNEFGNKVANLVLELTSNENDMKEAGTKAKYLLKKMNSMSKDALTIKLIDRLTNVEDFPTAPQKFIDKYKPQTEEILNGLSTTNSTHRKIIEEIRKIINKH